MRQTFLLLALMLVVLCSAHLLKMISVRNDDQLSFKDAPPYEPTVALGESPGAEQREAMLADLEDVDAPDAFVTADD